MLCRLQWLGPQSSGRHHITLSLSKDFIQKDVVDSFRLRDSLNLIKTSEEIGQLAGKVETTGGV